jgi:hypothetical protein
MSSLLLIKLAFAYKATTQCPRTDREPRSAPATVMSALGSSLAATATAPPRPTAPAPARSHWPFSLSFALHVAPPLPSAYLPASLCASVFRSRLLLFLSRCPSHSSSSPCCMIPPHPRFAPLVGPAAAAAPAAPAAPGAPPVAAAAAVAAVAAAARWAFSPALVVSWLVLTAWNSLLR